jgi:tungstate transport system substrate-binding protein
MRFVRALTAALLLLSVALAPGPARAESELLLATTTSVRDSGLLDAILPRFSEQTGVKVRTIAVGSGAALRMGAAGNADVLITHAPERERELVASGAIAARAPFMHNHFVIAGPAGDPADVSGADSPEVAMQRIRSMNAPWVSRADDSGTHMREQALFRSAGLAADPDWENVTRTGSGMGATLQVAGERRAYVLSDLGTFLAFRERVGLVAHSRPAPSLRNVYSVLHVNPERFDGRVNADGALKLETYLLAEPTQRAIAGFGVERFGRPLFQPLSDEEGDGADDD